MIPRLLGQQKDLRLFGILDFVSGESTGEPLVSEL